MFISQWQQGNWNISSTKVAHNFCFNITTWCLVTTNGLSLSMTGNNKYFDLPYSILQFVEFGTALKVQSQNKHSLKNCKENLVHEVVSNVFMSTWPGILCLLLIGKIKRLPPTRYMLVVMIREEFNSVLNVTEKANNLIRMSSKKKNTASGPRLPRYKCLEFHQAAAHIATIEFYCRIRATKWCLF